MTDDSPRVGRPSRGVAATNLHVRVTAEERAEVERRAAEAGISVSDYVRRRVLGKRVPRSAK